MNVPDATESLAQCSLRSYESDFKVVYYDDVKQRTIEAQFQLPTDGNVITFFQDKVVVSVIESSVRIDNAIDAIFSLEALTSSLSQSPTDRIVTDTAVPTFL